MRIFDWCSVLFVLALTTRTLGSQTTRPPSQPPCSDTASVPYRDRVAVELLYTGENRSEMWMAIQYAGETRTQCLVAKSARPVADTSVYGVLQINAVDTGGYEIATWLAGPRAPRTLCRSPRAAVTRLDTPILWGVLLAHTMPAFVECVLRARGPAVGSLNQ